MKKQLLISIIILTISILILISMGIFYFLNKNQPKIVGTKTFAEIQGFSFQYPEFEGWEVHYTEKVSDGEFIVFFNNPDTILFDSPPSMRVIKSNYPYKGPNNSTVQDNPNIKTSPGGIKYYASYDNPAESENGFPYINFYADDSIVTIYPFMYEGNGYSEKVCANKIIKTFKFSE
jgi:hypothetical protein